MNRTLYYILLAVIILHTTNVQSKTEIIPKPVMEDASQATPAALKKAVQEQTTVEADPVVSGDIHDADMQDFDGHSDMQVPNNKNKKRSTKKREAARKKMLKPITEQEAMDASDEQMQQSVSRTSDEEADLQAGFQSSGVQGDELEEMRKRRRMIIDLVREGKQFFIDNSLDVSCHYMIQTKKFMRGEVYLFVFDSDGFCLAQGHDTENLWQDFKKQKDEYGSIFVLDFIEKARAGGGWVSYRYRNASKVAYVEMVEKYGRQYIIGAGYYPHSKVYAAMNLVKGAVRFFKDSQAKDIENDSIFSTLSYPAGRFVSGDLYIFALDEAGTLVVQGDRPTLVGSNVLTLRDAKGVMTNQEIITRLNNSTEGIWIEYISKNALKRVYAERVTAKDGSHYYIACGYYPEATREKVVEIVQEGYRHMKKGVEQAFRDIGDRRDAIFHFGDIDLVVYNMKGVCVAHGSNQEYVGRPFYDEKDEVGNFYMRKLLEAVKVDGKGWINHKVKNAYEWIYFEKIDVGLEEYVITGGLFPISKREAMELLAKDAIGYIKESKELKYALSDFVKPTGRFSLGDLQVFAFEENGICAAYGSRTEYIWENMIGARDEAGRPYVKMFINAARRTPARVVYKMNGANALAYVERVVKDGITLFVGSSYYTYDNIESRRTDNLAPRANE